MDQNKTFSDKLIATIVFGGATAAFFVPIGKILGPHGPLTLAIPIIIFFAIMFFGEDKPNTDRSDTDY